MSSSLNLVTTCENVVLLNEWNRREDVTLDKYGLSYKKWILRSKNVSIES